MRIIALGDTHGRAFWKLIVRREKFDKLIFIGDYWDSFDIPYKEQYQNFLDIIAYKEANPDKVVLLLGNHDFHYTPVASMYGDKYSGYQKDKCYTIAHAMATHKSLIQVAHLHDNYLFTHAGVTQVWINRIQGLKSLDKFVVEEPIDKYINDLYQYKPAWFTFYEYDRSGYGESVGQSPIWVRPQSLNEDAYGDYIQVVGHTGQERMATEPVKFLGSGSGMFIDTLGSSGEYLIIEDDQIKIGKL